MVDYEIDDYNQEYFYNLEKDMEEYQSIMDEWEEPLPKEKDMSYNIFTLEQAISTINDIANITKDMQVAAHSAINAIDNFIKVYTRFCEEH